MFTDSTNRLAPFTPRQDFLALWAVLSRERNRRWGTAARLLGPLLEPLCLVGLVWMSSQGFTPAGSQAGLRVLVAGLLPWCFLSAAWGGAAAAAVEGQKLRNSLPVEPAFLALAPGLVALPGFLLGIAMTVQLWRLPGAAVACLTLAFAAFVLGGSVLLARVVDRFPFTGPVFRLGLPLLFLATPVLYAVEDLPMSLAEISGLHPLVPFFEAWRTVLSQGALPHPQVAAALAGWALVAVASAAAGDAGAPPAAEGANTTAVAALEAVALSCSASGPRHWSLQGIDLHLSAGEAVGLVGDSGAGKSAVLRVLAGIVVPCAGRVGVAPRTRALLDFEVGLEPESTGWQNARFLAAMYGVPPSLLEGRRRSVSVLAGVDLDEPLGSYSRGQRLGLVFAVAVLDAPDVLLLDDGLLIGIAGVQARIQNRLRELRMGGSALLIAHQDPSFLRRECDRVVWLQAGRIEASGATDPVLDRFLAAETRCQPVASGAGKVILSQVGGVRPIQAGESLELDVQLGAGDDAVVHLGARLRNQDGHELWGAASPHETILDMTGACVRLTLPELPLAPGSYRLEVDAFGEGRRLRRGTGSLRFEVTGEIKDRGPVALASTWGDGIAWRKAA